MGKGVAHATGTAERDPTELTSTVQPDAHRPTGACHTTHIIAPSRIWAALDPSAYLFEPSVRFGLGVPSNYPNIWRLDSRTATAVIGLASATDSVTSSTRQQSRDQHEALGKTVFS